MLPDIPALLDLLDKHRKENPGQITYTYQKLFGSSEGNLILIDLMDRFFEFKKPSNMEEVGAQAVLIYVKNTMRGVIDTTWYEPPKEESNNADKP
jgi:hypothetical protein